MLTATVKNLRSEMQEALIARGHNLEDVLDINYLVQVADEIGLPQAEPWKGFTFSGHSRNQRNEDGSPND